MTQAIKRTVNDVVRGALYLSGIVPRNQAIPGPLMSEAIEVLNEIIDELNSFGVTIPYYTDYTFNLVPGTRNYRFTPTLDATANNEVQSNLLAELVSVRLVSGNVEHNVRVDDINSVDIHGVLTGSQGLPQYVALQKYVMDGAGSGEPYSQVWFYAFPDTAYTCILRAKAQLSHVTNSQILTTLPPQMHRTLKYALGREMNAVYQLTNSWTPYKESKYQQLWAQIMPSTDYDMTIQNSRLLNNSNYWYSGRLLSGS